MQDLKNLRLSSLDLTHIEEVLSARQHLLEKALADHDLPTLHRLRALDKDNMQWLRNQKQSLQTEMHNLSKLRHYIAS